MKLRQSIVTELQSLLYDPTAIQSHVLNLLDNNIQSEVIDIPDASNPFMFLLESNALATTASLNEMSYHMRKLYPILASTKEELYHHLTMSEVRDIFTTPSEADFTFFIHRNLFKANGYRENNHVEIIIPRFTSILINGITFTLMNDVSVREYDSGGVIVRQLVSHETLGVQETTVLESGSIIDDNKEEWILFSVRVKQITVENVVKNIITSTSFLEDLPLVDKFVDATIKSNMASGKKEALNKTFSNFVYDKDYPTCYVKPLEDKVLLNIPILYTSTGSVSGDVEIDLFTSKGVISEPIDKFKTEDFTISFAGIGTIPQTESLNMITIYTKASTRTFGGRNEIDFDTLKKKVIMHTTGDNIIPITDGEISEAADKLDYEIKPSIDSILRREYVVSKELTDLGHEMTMLADVFMDKVKLDVSTIDDKFIKRFDKFGKSLIINPFTVFGLEPEKNILTPVTADELANLNSLKISSLIKDINNKKLFYTIYKYVMDYEDELLVRAYDLNQPVFDNIKDNSVNNALGSLLYVNNRKVERHEDSYILTFELTSDNQFKDISISDLRIEVGLKKPNSNIPIRYYGVVVEEDNILKGKVILDTTGYIDKDNKIFLTNFVSNVDVVNIDLVSEMSLYIYSIDTALATLKTSLTDELYEKEGVVALYRENGRFTFGTYLKHLYTNYTVGYTERKYKRYETDEKLRYTEDVYLTDEHGVVLDFDNEGNELTLLHTKGDPVLDEKGEFIILHKAGDVILDSNNDPIIDTVLGVEHFVDLLLLEYQYYISSNPNVKEYMIDLYKNLTILGSQELEGLNSKLLDNTKISYKPNNNLSDVKLFVNNLVYNSKNFVDPKVKLYVTRGDISIVEYNRYLDVISVTLQDGLRRKQRVSDIEDRVEAIIGDNVSSVKIEGLDNLEDLDIKRYTEDSSLIVLNKILQLDEIGTTSVANTIELKTIQI